MVAWIQESNTPIPTQRPFGKAKKLGLIGKPQDRKQFFLSHKDVEGHLNPPKEDMATLGTTGGRVYISFFHTGVFRIF